MAFYFNQNTSYIYRMSASRPTLAVIIPALNEAHNLPVVLDRVLALPLDKQVIVVDDGSTDATPQILEGYISKGVQTITNPYNMGKGASIRRALPLAKGRIIIIQDADLEYNPEDIPKVIQPIIDGRAQVVYGSRILGGGRMSYFSFLAGGLLLSWITNLLYKAAITDEPTCYKAFDRELLSQIKLECAGFEFCPEITAKILKNGIDILEVPIDYTPRSKSQGKKIRWKDGLIAIWTLIKYRLVN